MSKPRKMILRERDYDPLEEEPQYSVYWAGSEDYIDPVMENTPYYPTAPTHEVAQEIVRRWNAYEDKRPRDED